MKDEIAKEIVDELRLIREELQNLAMAIRSKVSNSEDAYSGKSRKPFQQRLEDQAYGVTVRQEIEFRSTLLSGGFLLFSARLNI
jgi:hypothetical protein